MPKCNNMYIWICMCIYNAKHGHHQLTSFLSVTVVTRQCKLWIICNWHRCHHCDTFSPPHLILSAFLFFCVCVCVFNQAGVGLLRQLRHIDTNVHSCAKHERVTEMVPRCTNTAWDCSFSERKCCSWCLAYNPTAFPAQHSTFLRSQQVVGAHAWKLADLCRRCSQKHDWTGWRGATHKMMKVQPKMLRVNWASVWFV